MVMADDRRALARRCVAHTEADCLEMVIGLCREVAAVAHTDSEVASGSGDTAKDRVAFAAWEMAQLADSLAAGLAEFVGSYQQYHPAGSRTPLGRVYT